MYENTVVNVKITMGNIPLTVSQDATQFGYPTQSPIQNNSSTGQLPTNITQTLGFIEPTLVPGFAQQVLPFGQSPVPYPQQSIISPQSSIPNEQPSLYPQTPMYNQSQIPYPDLNIPQPAFNPSYQDSNPNVNPTPTAPF